ncbi:S1 RNA-binding domain-containing protein [Candidatus Saccharibacteria bacterium]|nr:S1 RNA-binding domain-containing protein [Candidatus Saccharibacteria bacterium]
MDELLQSSPDLGHLQEGELVKGKVLSVKKHEILVDLGPRGVGITPRWEASASRDLEVGQEVEASVLDEETKDGYVLLSFKKAAKDKGWEELIAKKASGETITVTPYDVNRGGLLLEYEGVRGFMPVSQLTAEHYPRVSSNDKEEIIAKLRTLIGVPMQVVVLDADKRESKLIFSEREAARGALDERVANLKIGDVVEGVVTGVVAFGIFVNVDGIEGLVHISEISWERVEDPNQYAKVGERIKAKIISVDKDRLSLSMKQLQADPWELETKDLVKDQEVEGTITRITPFGAFVQIRPAVEALVHVSELGTGGDDPEKVFALNDKKTFKILDIDTENRKISLSLKK